MARTKHPVQRRVVDLSARFTAGERNRVESALARTGKNMTDFIRDAVLGSADEILGGDARAAFADAIGVIDVPSDVARRSDAVYADMLLEKHAESRRRTRRAKPAPGR